MDFKKLLTRSLSGLIYALIIIGSIFWGDAGIVCLTVLLGIVATFELLHILKVDNTKIIPVLDSVGVIALGLSFNNYIPVLPVIIWVCYLILLIVK